MNDYLVLAPISQLKSTLEKDVEKFEKCTSVLKQNDLMVRILEVLHELKRRAVPAEEIRPYFLTVFNHRRKREHHHALKNNHLVGRYNKTVYPAPSGIVC